MDICGPFNHEESFRGKFAIVMVDYFSKWPEVRIVDNVKLDVVIGFCREVFSREGIH